MHTSAPPSIGGLRRRLPDLMLRDRRRLSRRLDGVRKSGTEKAAKAIEQLAKDVDAAERRVAQRRANAPAVTYPPELPVAQHKDDIAAAIRDHQVVIIAGETGSGKTTQLPKICLELGRGITGSIGHTQPRRIAARTVSERIAEELKTPLGEAVGYKVRFTDKASDNTLVKVMTDGILLAELQNDRMLWQYDTLIIDEAHERSLNIDFILGYVKQLLPRRPDLKLIITSATIDPERFAEHFDNAPIIEVSGRTYPVEVRYRPLQEQRAEEAADEDRDQIQAICDAVDELALEPAGDVLVFLSGEREIRDTADALGKQNLRNTEVLPLYARLSAAEQHRVFQPHAGRRIVLATNVAETSLTVPGIKYVVDPGTARISRYSSRLKVQRLPIEPISQASANQRKGRCGRTSDGICIRLYSEEDFEGRPEFTEPEILRTNLASVILQMTTLGLGDVDAFPFVDPPDKRNVKAGVELLQEIGAFDAAVPGKTTDASRTLTPIGRKLAQLPLDPRLARMVLEADKNGCVREVMVIASALAIQDPRERPADKQQQADQKHARFTDKDSDFSAYLNLWNYLQEQQKALSSNQFRKLCRNEYLNYLRVREWQDVESQLRQLTKQLGITLNSTPGQPQHINTALLSGLLSHIGLKESDSFEYQGARGAKFAIFPGSGLFKKNPLWVMAGELVETTRLWARIVARIEPEWVEPLAEHLVKRTYSEPHWSKKQEAVLAYERVTLYGVPIVAQRRVNYGRIDQEMSRELFIRHALVQGEWETRHHFFADNLRLLEDVEDLENRVRRRDIKVDDQTLFEFYDERVGAEVVSARHFDTWWKQARREQPDLLNFEKSMLVNDSAADVSEQDFPDDWQQDHLTMPLSYAFEPGTSVDGVTVDVPLAVLNQVSEEDFQWQVPGRREELVTELIRSLPKSLRRNFVPAPNYARSVLENVVPGEGSMLEAIGRELLRLTGVQIPRDAWDLDKIPAHLRITFRVLDGKRTLAEGKDLAALKRQLTGRLRESLSKAAKGIEQTGLREWSFGALPKSVEEQRNGQRIVGYPALVDERTSVAIRVLETEAEQRRAMWTGTRRLLLLGAPSVNKYVLSHLRTEEKLALSRAPHGSATALFDDCLSCVVDKVIADAGGPAWDRAGFDALAVRVRSDLHDLTLETVAKVAAILTSAHSAELRIAGLTSYALAPVRSDLEEQLAGLVHAGFVTEAGWQRLTDLRRYLRGIERRLDKLPDEPHRDLERTGRIRDLDDLYADAVAALPPGVPLPDELRQVRWMLEELRISLFAQTLGTPQPVSEKRIRRALDALLS
ncbi:ATP-dependent RNA helicase [Flindersiella endophytica]